MNGIGYGMLSERGEIEISLTELIMINHHHDDLTDRQFPGHANPIAGCGAEEGQVCSTSCQGEDNQQPHKSSLLRIFLLKIGFLRFFNNYF